MSKPERGTKYGRIYAALRAEIDAGRFAPGSRIPSEAQLAERFRVSRITVIHAVRNLQAAGLVERRVGAGTFVKAARRPGGLSFGLLVPDLAETEIFEPMCQGIVSSPAARQHALLWGHSTVAHVSDEAVLAACRQYIERGVSGVFFAPVESSADAAAINARVLHELDEAGIPAVLLDRNSLPYPAPPDHDLVGIDNRRAGYRITQHLIDAGCRRIGFIGAKRSAPTTDARAAGYREALIAADLPATSALVRRSEGFAAGEIDAYVRSARPDGIVCANDRTAGAVMHALRQIGVSVPSDVRIVGIDDVQYASLLPVPLTTLRQPAREIGDVALAVMVERIARPDLPPRETHLACRLIVRESCGAAGACPPRPQ
jgi:GntR family transcriptional regulator, arabinose operon transcriptional repressor